MIQGRGRVCAAASICRSPRFGDRTAWTLKSEVKLIQPRLNQISRKNGLCRYLSHGRISQCSTTRNLDSRRSQQQQRKHQTTQFKLIKHISFSHLTGPSLCSLSSSAYQLRVCQPPPEVASADILMEDGELEIGELPVWHVTLMEDADLSVANSIHINHQDHDQESLVLCNIFGIRILYLKNCIKRWRKYFRQ